MKKVMSTNPYKVPKNDVYGRLYFYLVDKLRKLSDLLKTNKV